MLECFQKVVERFRKMITIQHCIILDTFNRQFTKPKQDSILCVSNFHIYMLSNVTTIQAFLCLAKPDPIALHSYITFSSVCNWKQTFQSIVSKSRMQFFFVITSFFFPFSFLGWGCEIKDTLQWIPRVLFIGKTQGFFSSAEVLMPSTANIYIR